MKKNIIITGGTGLIGYNLCRMLHERGDVLTVLARNPASAKKILPFAENIIKWDVNDSKDYSGYMEGQDAVINLSGASVVGSKWTAEYKQEILNSRVNTNKKLVEAVGKCVNKPSVFVCASAIGYYGSRGNEIITEKSSPGTDFLSGICVEWESSAAAVEEFGVRRASIRTGIVLDKRGGALNAMVKTFRFFLGGTLGSGEFWYSWIHWKDLCNIYIFALDNPKISGGINAVAPMSETMGEFCKILGRVIKRPVFLPVPEMLIRLGLGEGANVLLASLRVIPAILNREGFKFEFIKAEDALRNILNK